MIRIGIVTRQGHTIETTVENMDQAKQLMKQPHIIIEGEGRLTAIAVSAIDLLDARELAEPASESED